MKKVTMNAKPLQAKPAPSVAQWVQSRTAEEGTKL